MLPHDGGAGGGRGRCTGLPAAVAHQLAKPSHPKARLLHAWAPWFEKALHGRRRCPVASPRACQSACFRPPYRPFGRAIRPVSQSVTARLPMRCGPGRCASEAASWIIFTKNECPHSAKCCGLEGIGKGGLLVVMSCRSLLSSAESSGVACKSCSQPTPG